MLMSCVRSLAEWHGHLFQIYICFFIDIVCLLLCTQSTFFSASLVDIQRISRNCFSQLIDEIVISAEGSGQKTVGKTEHIQTECQQTGILIIVSVELHRGGAL